VLLLVRHIDRDGAASGIFWAIGTQKCTQLGRGIAGGHAKDGDKRAIIEQALEPGAEPSKVVPRSHASILAGPI
jgi:hypothetical protein